MKIRIFFLFVVLTLVFLPLGIMAQSCEDFASALVSIERQNMNRRCPIKDRNYFFATGLGDNAEAIDWEKVKAHYVWYCEKGVNPMILDKQLEHDLGVRDDAMKAKPDCGPAKPPNEYSARQKCAEAESELAKLESDARESRLLGIRRAINDAERSERLWREVNDRSIYDDDSLDRMSNADVNAEVGRYVQATERLRSLNMEPPELKDVQLAIARLWLDFWTAVMSGKETRRNLHGRFREKNLAAATQLHNTLQSKLEELEKARTRITSLRRFLASDCNGQVGAGPEKTSVSSGDSSADNRFNGTWALWQDNQLRIGPPIALVKLTIRGTTLTITGDGFSGQGVFDGRTGHYDWRFADGRQGRTTLRLDSEGVLHGQVRGSGVNWDFQALKGQ